MILRRSCPIFAVALLATLSLVQPGTAAEPRWTPLGPPAAPLAARLIVEPGNGNRAYAFNEAGLWRSRDDAGSWRSIQVGLNRVPQAFTFDPSRPGRLYAMVTEIDQSGTIYRSDDFGDRWTVISRRDYVGSYYSQDLEVDPFAPDTLLWLSDQFLFRSRDAGRTWECFPVSGGCVGPVTSVLAFDFAPDRPGTIYAVGGDFHTTHDGGRTWTVTGLPQGNLDVLVATREPRTLYAWSRQSFYRGDGSCIVRSDDEGVTWKQILPNTKCGAPAVDRADPRTVRIVVVENGEPRLWVSRNGGDTWSSAGTVPEIGDLYVVPGGGLALATVRGFFRAPGEQGPWRASNRGFGASQVTAVLPAGEAVLAAPAHVDNAAVPLLRTEDGGRSWTPEPLNNAIALAADPADPRHLIASAVRYEGPTYIRHPRVLESLDGGDTWRGVVDPQIDPPVFLNLAIDPFEPRTFYAGTQFGGFYVSLDGGRTWRASNAGLRYAARCFKYYCPPNWVRTLLPDPTKEGRIFIQFNNSLYSTLDGGLNWTQLRPQAPAAGTIQALARDPQGGLIVLGSGVRDGDSASLGVVYRSTDGGATWTRLGRLPVRPNVGVSIEITGLAATRGALWVSVNALGVFRSTDGGRTWKAANEGLPLVSVSSLVQDAEDAARLFVTIPGNGIYTLAAP